VNPEIALRRAHLHDVPVLNALIARSARALSVGFYTPEQSEAAIRHVFGVDTALVDDGTYLVAEIDGQLAGCGGWSRRRTLYGGDQRPVGDKDLLDPAVDAARIRAFFVAPEWARRGVGRRILEACDEAAAGAGFTSLELMATLPGVPMYAACGFTEIERVVDLLPDGTALPFVRMGRSVHRRH
jgi:GNAT superfamily N-acetyltransferase